MLFYSVRLILWFLVMKETRIEVESYCGMMRISWFYHHSPRLWLDASPSFKIINVFLSLVGWHKKVDIQLLIHFHKVKFTDKDLGPRIGCSNFGMHNNCCQKYLYAFTQFNWPERIKDWPLSCHWQFSFDWHVCDSSPTKFSAPIQDWLLQIIELNLLQAYTWVAPCKEIDLGQSVCSTVKLSW